MISNVIDPFNNIKKEIYQVHLSHITRKKYFSLNSKNFALDIKKFMGKKILLQIVFESTLIMKIDDYVILIEVK